MNKDVNDGSKENVFHMTPDSKVKDLWENGTMEELIRQRIPVEQLVEYEEKRSLLSKMEHTLDEITEYESPPEEEPTPRRKHYKNDHEFRLMSPLYEFLEAEGFFVNSDNEYEKLFLHCDDTDLDGRSICLRLVIGYIEKETYNSDSDKKVISRSMYIKKERIAFTKIIGGKWAKTPNYPFEETTYLAKLKTEKKIKAVERAIIDMELHCCTPVEQLKEEHISEFKKRLKNAIFIAAASIGSMMAYMSYSFEFWG